MLVARLEALPTTAARAPVVLAWQVARLAAMLVNPGPVAPDRDALRAAGDALRRWIDAQPVSRDLRRTAARACDAIGDRDPMLASAALESLRLSARDLLDAPSHAALADVAYQLRELARTA